jgi:hypothetical protein
MTVKQRHADTTNVCIAFFDILQYNIYIVMNIHTLPVPYTLYIFQFFS